MTENDSTWFRDAFDAALGRDINEAIAEQLALVETDPTNPKPYCALGAFFHMQGRTEDAIMMYRHALRLDPDYALAHQSLGQVFAAREKFADAWRHAREADRLGNSALLDSLTRNRVPEQ